MVLNMASLSEFDDLLAQIRNEYQQAKRQASLSEAASNFRPVIDIGVLVREERVEQGLTINRLCDLSGVAYVTLSKLERGESSVRLDTLEKVLGALGLKLWVG
jgi:DNA-binding Xre family transcriptional regulator